MALKTYNPVTAGQRQLVLSIAPGLDRACPVKALTEGKNSTGGRNNSGSHYQPAIAAAATRRRIASSTSSAASSTRSSRSSE